MEVRVSLGFDAGHKVPGSRARCERQHGHHWTVSATTRSRDGDHEDGDHLFADLVPIVAEWRDRDLNEMITNFSETTPERLAPWIMERLLARQLMLTAVSVSDGIVEATVRREPPLR